MSNCERAANFTEFSAATTVSTATAQSLANRLSQVVWPTLTDDEKLALKEALRPLGQAMLDASQDHGIGLLADVAAARAAVRQTFVDEISDGGGRGVPGPIAATPTITTVTITTVAASHPWITCKPS